MTLQPSLSPKNRDTREGSGEWDSRCEVCCRGGRLGGVCVERGAPDGPLMAQERPDPVPRVPLP